MSELVEQVAELIDPEAEQIILGGILRDGSLAYHAAVEGRLEPEHFGIGKNAFLFRLAGELINAGREPLIGEVADELSLRGQLWQVDGLTGLIGFEEKAVDGRMVTGFAQTVRRKAFHRRGYAISAGIERTIRAAGSPDEICRLAGELQTLYENIERKAHGETFEECLGEIGGFDALLSPPAGLVPFPFEGPVAGMAPGQLITIGGRSSMGKTIVACHVALYAAGSGFRTLFVSLEMGRGEMLRRLLAMVGRVRHSDLQGGLLTRLQREAVNGAATRLAEWPLGIVSEPGTLEGLAAKVAAARSKGEAYQLVVIDYLGLIQTGDRFENRTAEVSYISRTLKRLAMQNQVPILALAQLNRASDSRPGDHEPQLSDLRDSGAIEQDSDIVGFIHRPDYYRPNDQELRNVARLIFRKHRNGPIGTVELTFVPEFVMFTQIGGPR